MSAAADLLQQHAERIRTGNALGRSALLMRLFDFLVSCSTTGRVPKEIEVALDVFGKTADFDVAQDAVVRVYVHKLRRKLDEYYAGPGRGEDRRLMIPKGEYRLVLQDRQQAVPPETEAEDPALASAAEAELESLVASAAARRPQRNWRAWAGAAIVAIAAALLTLLWVRSSAPRDAHELQQVRANPLWARMLDDDLPIYVAVGDYYIFGELDAGSSRVGRLVRAFDINSANELEQYLKNNPELADRYMDMSMNYLPTSVAFALRNVMPLLEPNRKGARQVQVLLASDLKPNMVKSAHIIYVGLLSGMGVLRELVFSGSGFQIGETYDELFDTRSQQHYVSQASLQRDARNAFIDYGFVSSRTGADGNELLVLAGTRDVALMHVAEALTQAASLQALDQAAGAAYDIEALYAVRGLDQTNLDGQLLQAYRLGTAASR